VHIGYNHAPDIDGADPAWAAWIERWHGTSTLTPKVRATIRTIMAKTGRWMAVEHPETTEPGQRTRLTCVGWVGAVDRMSVGAEGVVDQCDRIIGEQGVGSEHRNSLRMLGELGRFDVDQHEAAFAERQQQIPNMPTCDTIVVAHQPHWLRGNPDHASVVVG
jgi:hypothetical protein